MLSVLFIVETEVHGGKSTLIKDCSFWVRGKLGIWAPELLFLGSAVAEQEV